MARLKVKPHVFAKGDSIFFVSKLAPITPSAEEVEEYAFADAVRKAAPNENLMWLRGQYVEADAENANGQMWTEGELAIKALTPNFMPITVMHDPRTAVGLIADTKLLVPEKDNVPRSRIDTDLAIWAHRFPDVAEEAMVNYEQATLMQSMECKSPFYSCAECAQTFAKIPPFDERGIGRERKQWCSHLNENARRILGNVVFTGTGLIFGTRGARGANDKAHLEIFQEEVAEYHERAHRGSTSRRKPTSRRASRMDEIEISRSEYDALNARPTQEAFDAEKARADKAEEEKAEAIKASEEAEAAKTKAEEEKAEADKKVTEFEEKAQKDTLGADRLSKLGSGFRAKIESMPNLKARFEEQAKSMSDEDWTSRVEEVAEMTGVKSDAKKEGEKEADDGDGGGSEEFSSEEIAASHAARNNGHDGGGDAKQKSTVAGLFAGTGPAKKSS